MKIKTLYKIVDEEARRTIETDKLLINAYPGQGPVFTLVKLKSSQNLYYCTETKKVCAMYPLGKAYADNLLLEIYNKNKENN